jgi:threonine dehydratase
VSLVTPESIVAAARELESVAVRTPLLLTRWLDDAGLGADVRIKAESLQRAGAFKFRGAYTMIRRLAETDRRRGVIAPSSGNHGQAVALAARLFEIPAIIVMPTSAARVKIEGARRWGATVVFAGTKSSERQARAEELAAERGYVMVPPYDHPDVIAGQGTVGREIIEDWPEVEAILVPTGGGGLVSGVAAWIKRAKPGCRVIGVEPEGSDVIGRSLRAGHPVTLAAPNTIADGLRSDRTGEVAFAHLRELVDEMVTVPDPAIELATRRLLLEGKLVVEFSGAVGLAALLAGRWPPAGRRTALVISGGNLDPAIIGSLAVGPITRESGAVGGSTPDSPG